VIGGSGIYQMDGVQIVNEYQIPTPFGPTSSPVVEALMDNKQVFFIARHGQHHSLTPSEVPYQANIYALKTLQVTHLMAISAVGIMKENIHPGDMVIPDQIFDRTKGTRPSTFFSDGIVGHVQFADPFCPQMRELILAAATKTEVKFHDGGTYVCMEGPQFSTRAESEFYRRTLAPAVIGMTAIPEAKLAREAELSYAMLALATDYDCWHQEEEAVSVDAVIAVLKKNVSLAHKILSELVRCLPESSIHPNLYAAKNAIMSKPEMIPHKTKEKLTAIYGHYW
jgi:5'-methylthioadenosine phosphorylase